MAVVLCGGTSRRMGIAENGDKTRAPLHGGTVLDHLLDGLPADWFVVCVGARRRTARSVTWAREDPPGGGPVAGVAAGLACRLPADPAAHGGDGDRCGPTVVIAGDMPYAASAAVALVARLSHETDLDAVVARGPDGRTQPLLAAYRAEPLARALPREPAGARAMALLERLRWLPFDVDAAAALDVDTPDELDRARHMVRP